MGNGKWAHQRRAGKGLLSGRYGRNCSALRAEIRSSRPARRNRARPGGGDCNWAHEWTTHQRAAAREDRIAPAEQYNRILTVGTRAQKFELAEGGAGVRGISHGLIIAFCTRSWPMSLRRGFGRRKG